MANAIFYTPHEGSVYVSADTRETEVVVEIRDQGPGVPENQLEGIFRAFYRVDSSRAWTNGGFGLGLALVKGAVVQHGGRVFAYNANPGLLVTVYLPVGIAEIMKHE